MLLVDDESLFLDHLRHAISWEDYGCAVCGEARDGAAALGAAETLKPDIVFMDINLPKMDGLAVCQQIYRLPDPPHVIVVTAHGEFSFAYKAIKLGVFDYLLKPFDTEELVGALQKCMADIRQARSRESLRRNKETDDMERYFQYVLELEQAGSPPWISLPPDAVFLASIIRIHQLRHGHLTRIRADIAQLIDGALKVTSYITGIHLGAVVVIHVMNRGLPIEALRDRYGLLQDREVEDGGNYDCIGLGGLALQQGEIPRSYQQAVAALENRSRTGGFVVAYQDVENLSNAGPIFRIQDVNLLIKLFEAGQYEEADEAIEKIFALSEGRMLSFQYVLSVYQSLLVSIHSRYPNSEGISWDSLTGHKSFLRELNTCGTTREIVDILKNYIHEAFSDCMQLQVPSKSDVLVRKIDQLLLQQYAQENLTVNQVAQALFFESSYVRRVYKTLRGKTIMQRLEEIRMEKAKELLEQTNHKGSAIAGQVGYTDPFYFSKRFKLYAGLSPSDYRNRLALNDCD